jgi:hypothetical protein
MDRLGSADPYVVGHFNRLHWPRRFGVRLVAAVMRISLSREARHRRRNRAGQLFGTHTALRSALPRGSGIHPARHAQEFL